MPIPGSHPGFFSNNNNNNRSNVSRLYLPRREGGSGLISVEDAINIDERNINVYVCQSQERLLKAAWKRKNVKEIETPKEYQEKMKRKRTEDWSGKQLHGQFKRETDDLSGEIGRVVHKMKILIRIYTETALVTHL